MMLGNGILLQCSLKSLQKVGPRRGIPTPSPELQGWEQGLGPWEAVLDTHRPLQSLRATPTGSSPVRPGQPGGTERGCGAVHKVPSSVTTCGIQNKVTVVGNGPSYLLCLVGGLL